MEEQNQIRPMVTISADEYFDLRSRAESCSYIVQSVEHFRSETEHIRRDMYGIRDEIDQMRKQVK